MSELLKIKNIEEHRLLNERLDNWRKIAKFIQDEIFLEIECVEERIIQIGLVDIFLLNNESKFLSRDKFDTNIIVGIYYNWVMAFSELLRTLQEKTKDSQSFYFKIFNQFQLEIKPFRIPLAKYQYENDSKNKRPYTCQPIIGEIDGTWKTPIILLCDDTKPNKEKQKTNQIFKHFDRNDFVERFIKNFLQLIKEN